MSVRFWLSLVSCSLLSSTVLADQPAKKKVPAQAPAALHVSCDFVEIMATKGKTASMDGKLAPMEKKLKKSPFSQWNDFKQLSQTTRKLEKKKTESISLKHGSATATLQEIVDKSKARIVFTMDNAEGKRKVDQQSVLEAGDYVIHLLVLPNEDGHLLAVTCK